MNKKLKYLMCLTILLTSTTAYANNAIDIQSIEKSIDISKHLDSDKIEYQAKELTKSVDYYNQLNKSIEKLTEEYQSISKEENDKRLSVSEKKKSTDDSSNKINLLTKKLDELNKKSQEKLEKERIEKEKIEKERIEKERIEKENQQAVQNQQTTQHQQVAQNSSYEYSLSQFMQIGRLNWGGYQYTYYSQSVTNAPLV